MRGRGTAGGLAAGARIYSKLGFLLHEVKSNTRAQLVATNNAGVSQNTAGAPLRTM